MGQQNGEFALKCHSISSIGEEGQVMDLGRASHRATLSRASREPNSPFDIAVQVSNGATLGRASRGGQSHWGGHPIEPL